jgi:hypothetical protein
MVRLDRYVNARSCRHRAETRGETGTPTTHRYEHRRRLVRERPQQRDSQQYFLLCFF